jgi:hypothetical protein
MNTYTLTNDTLTVTHAGRTHMIRRGTKNFEAARDAALAGNWDVLVPLLSAGLTIERWLGGDWKVRDNLITYKGETIDQALNQRLLRMATEGANPSGWLKFWERLQANPSWRSVHQLYHFLAHQGIPIDEKDGFLLTYKSVTHDYKDHHTRKWDNRPGVTNEMPRNKISDDPNVACHEGFHVGAIGYALTFGSDKRIVICKVDPADVVCVPYDASYMKMRVCKYVVVGNYSGEPLPSTVFTETLPTVAPPVEEEEFEGTDDDLVDDTGEDESLDAQAEAPPPEVVATPETPPAKAPETVEGVVSAIEADDKWTGNAALHHLLRPKAEGGWGLRQFEVIKRTGLDSGHLSRAARDMVTLGSGAVARILAAFPEAFAPDWASFGSMGPVALMDQEIDALRRYASEGLLIVGVSQIATKAALVDRIMQVRSKRSSK